MTTQTRIHIPTYLALLFGVIGGLASNKASGDLILMDNMSSPNYISFFFNNNNNPNDNSSASFTPQSTGGNPLHNLLIEHSYNVFDENGDASVFLQSIFVNQSMSMTYNPVTAGTISNISFSLDILTDPGFSDVYFIVQDSNGGQGAGFTSISPNANWQTISVSGLTNANFSSRNFAGNLDLQFGFGFLSSGTYSGAQTFGLNVDNFKVTITSVPEPSSGMLVGAILLIAAYRRRVSRK